jgi:SAM-dependent methyltransferase
MVSTEDVRAAYRLILDRAPENEDVLIEHARRYNSVAELRDAFLNSAEFQHLPHRYTSPALPYWEGSVVEVDASSDELSEMIRRVTQTWRHLGTNEPYWSVVTREQFRAATIGAHEDAFYDSGQKDLLRLKRAAQRCRITLARYKDCFELGCGVGRLTVWLAHLFSGRVIAADLSAPHLDLAKQALQRFGRQNVEVVQLREFSDFEILPDYDVFISLIVLQHNPPPVIALLLKTVLRKLRPGGVAYFQVPTFFHSYGFTVEEYLSNPTAAGQMEMHVFPQQALFEIIEQSDCRLLEIREDDLSGNSAMLSNSLLVSKDAPPSVV